MKMSSSRANVENIVSAAKFLGVTIPVSRVVLKAAYRTAAAKKHPDAGGSTQEFHTVVEAYHTLINYTYIDTCDECRGAGSLSVGVYYVRRMCPKCLGSGKVK